jgi:hypothetical protein
MSRDIAPTYRGYRKQALYALFRILTDTDADRRLYKPESAEDIGVYNASGLLLEAVQVKDLSQGLSLSALKPHSPDGFFARLRARRVEHPDCISMIATYGPLGGELDCALNGDEAQLNAITKKLCAKWNENDGIAKLTETEAHDLVASLSGHIVDLSEDNLTRQINKALEETEVGGDLKTAIDLFTCWIYSASEKHETLTKQSLFEELHLIGQYLANLRDGSRHWMTSIKPLLEAGIQREEHERLQMEYCHGVQARWTHIAADLDVPRKGKLSEIHDQFAQHKIVVIHGASGQGKSSLGLRYMKDYWSDHTRFQINLKDGRSEIPAIANALRAHIKQLNLDAIAWVDVAPTDSGWVDLLRELADANVKVLVAVREEDLQRAGLRDDQFDLGQVSLGFLNSEEAEAIYDGLPDAKRHSPTFIDAWARFNRSKGGPLLEFTHFLTQGKTLSEKIQGQIQRLTNEAESDRPEATVTKKHIRALALAAMANSVGCRVSEALLRQAAELGEYGNPFALLEAEFFLRVGEDGTIAGLHILRSTAILDALICGNRDRLTDLITSTLPLVLDGDVETFLEIIFSRYSEASNSLSAAIDSLVLRNWEQTGGICRALVWYGISEHERENHEKLNSLVEEWGSSWLLMCDSFVGGGENAVRNLRETFKSVNKTELPWIELSPMDRIFVPLGLWLAKIHAPQSNPITEGDWFGIADLMHWIATRKISGSITDKLTYIADQALPQGLGLLTTSRFVLARYEWDRASFSAWHASASEHLADLFLSETGSLHLIDDGESVTVFFLVPDADGESAETRIGELAGRLCNQLRYLYPHRKRFITKDFGGGLAKEILGHNPWEKDIPVENLPNQWVTSTNALFLALVDYRHHRCATWQEYIEEILHRRENAIFCFRKLYKTWEKFLAEKTFKKTIIDLFLASELPQLSKIANAPMLPKIAVDELGLSSETQASNYLDPNSHKNIHSSFALHNDWGKLVNDYFFGITCCSQQAEKVILAAASIKTTGHAPLDNDGNGGRLFLFNLRSAWEGLGPMQRLFRLRFGSLVDKQRLDELERHETSTFAQLWEASVRMVYNPSVVVSNVGTVGIRESTTNENKFCASLRTEFEAAGALSVEIRESEKDGFHGLFVIVDHASFDDMGRFNTGVYATLWRAAHMTPHEGDSWVPIAIRWSKIFVVSTIGNRAYGSTGIERLTSMTFLTDSEPQLSPLGIMHSEIPVTSLHEIGVLLNESPIVSAAWTWFKDMFDFTFRLSRVAELFPVLVETRVPQANLDRVLGEWSRSLRRPASTALNSTLEFQKILHVIEGQPSSETISKHWEDRVQQLKERHLLVSGDGGTVELDEGNFAKWIEGAATRGQEMLAIVGEIVDVYGTRPSHM